jgi:CheY-like chemotaxis protein
MRRSDLLRGRTVLVIEDDDDTREVVSRLVEALGATTVVAADGLEGLVQLERRRPDAVLCDLAMPIMNGIEFARRMRQKPPLPGDAPDRRDRTGARRRLHGYPGRGLR